MKRLAREPQQYVTDAQGNRVAVMLDLATYERLLDAADEASCVRAYDTAKPMVQAELKAGKFTTLKEYRTVRARR